MHPSRVLDRAQSYERLEFLGDSALGFIVARALYERYPDVSEGTLSRLRSSVVSRKSCAAVAREIGLDRMFAEQFELTDDLRRSDNVISALTEAAIAALVLEHGIEPVSAPVLEAFEHQISAAEHRAGRPQDAAPGGGGEGGLEGELRRHRLATGRRTTRIVHVRGDRRRKAPRHRLGQVEEGGAAGGCGGGARRARASRGVASRARRRHPHAALALGGRVPPRDLHSRLQVVPRSDRDPARAGCRGRRRAERLREVEHRATRCSGRPAASRRASCGPNARTTSCSAGRPGTRRLRTARCSCCSTRRPARSPASTTRRSRSRAASTAAARGST